MRRSCKTLRRLTTGSPSILEFTVIPASGGRGCAEPLFEKGFCKSLMSEIIRVTSMGGLPYGVTETDFLGGCSIPRNKEIMRGFRDLEIVEHLGSGVPRTLSAYGREAFEIRDSFIRIIFPYEKAEEAPEEVLDKGLDNTKTVILHEMKSNPQITGKQLSDILRMSMTAIERNIKQPREAGMIRRIGGTCGHWEVSGEQSR